MNPQYLHVFLLVVAFGGSVAAYTTFHRLLVPPPPEETESDIAKIAKKAVGSSTAFSSLSPSGGLLDRLDLFLLKVLRLEGKIEEFHMLLGRPAKPTPVGMLHLKEGVALGAGVLIYLLTYNPVLAVVFTIGGFYVVDFVFKGRIEARQRAIMKTFPAFVDLEAITIEAGLDYMTAFERILKTSNAKIRSELEKELEMMVSEIQLGYARRDAMKRMAMRVGLQEMRSFVGLVVQSDELGTSLVELLRNYAGDMRFRRLNRAEKLAAQASTKMLLPLFFFIFPTVFIMLLSPMVQSLFSGGLGF